MSFQNGHALLIGVGTHQNHPKLNVPITVADAEAVEGILKDANYCGYPSNQVQLIKEKAATKAGILAALDSLSSIPQTDTVFLFFAGHGSLGTDGSYYLVSHDVQMEGSRVVAGTGVSEKELLEKLNAIQTKRLFMVFNACHSAYVAPGSLSTEEDEPIPGTLNPSGNTANALLGTGEGRILIVACRENQLSYFTKDSPTTIFTTNLVEGLQGGYGSSNGGTISAFGLYEYVYSEVSDTVASELKRVQEPVLTVIRGVGPFPVALYRGASALGNFEDDSDVLEGTAVEKISEKKAARSFQKINTGGGAYVGGDVEIRNGDFVGRDKIKTVIHGDQVGGDKFTGDKIGGDKITTGDISGSGIAIGRGAQAIVNTYRQQGANAETISAAFANLYESIQAIQVSESDKEMAIKMVDSLNKEAQKGDNADEKEVNRWFNSLVTMLPDIGEVAIDTFINPIKGLSTIFRKVAAKARENKG